jgi:hypothetical protein
MGYIKKLKNNELVGGTDKITIYPVTSTKAVFEEVTEGDKSSFKSQETINGEHDGRIKGLENEMPDTVKSITINGGTEHTVDESGNVDLTIYTVNPDDPDVPAMVNLVEKNRDDIADIKEEIGTDTTENTLSGRIKSLETTVGTGGSVDQRISNGITTALNNLDAEYTDDGESYIDFHLKETNGVVDDFAIEDTKLKNAITSLTNAIGGGNIALVESLPSTGDAGKIYRVVNNDNTYTDYMYVAGESTPWKPLAVHDLSTIQPQIAYYTCTALGSGALETKVFVSNGSLTYSTANGGHIKIKMGEANTHAAPVYLKFNTEDSTSKQVYYNGEPVSANNSWDAGEVISVYYDGTYYQASNAMGGGSAVGKKRLMGATGYLTTNGDAIGAYNSLQTWRYIKYPVNPGDVVMVSGQGGSSPRLYAIAREDDTIIQKEETVNAIKENLVLVMPEEAKWIVLNNNYSTYPNYEWYFAKKGSVGAHEMLAESYLYGDLRTLAVGQAYEKGEGVKTTDKQFFRMTKEVDVMNLTDEVAVGDLKVYGVDGTGTGANTYKAVSAVSAYTTSQYSDGDYAIGSPTKLVLSIAKNVSAGNILVKFGENSSVSVSVQNTSTPSDVASNISTGLNSAGIAGWVFSASGNTVIATCNTVGSKAGTVFSVENVNIVTGVTGVAGGNYGDESTQAVLTLTISIGVGTIDVALGDAVIEGISVSSSEDSTTIAGKIVLAGLTGWELTDNQNGTITAVCATGGNNSNISFTINDTTAGVSGSVNEVLWDGSSTLSIYNPETGWSVETLDNYATSSVWESITTEELKTLSTEQNTLSSYLVMNKSLTSNTYVMNSNTRVLYRGVKLIKDKTYSIYVKTDTATDSSKYSRFSFTNGISGKVKCKETVTNTGEIEIKANMLNGTTFTFTPKENVESSNFIIYSKADQATKMTCVISWDENASTLSEKIEWDESQKEINYQQITKTIAPKTQGRYIMAMAENANFGNPISINNSYWITDYVDCVDAKKINAMLITANSITGAGLVFYDVDKNPIVTPYDYYIVKSPGNLRMMVNVPENAAFFRNSTWSGAWSYTFYYNRNITDQVDYLTEEVTNLVEKTNTIPEGMPTYTYEGERLSIAPKFTMERRFNVYGGGQGCACYGDYLFEGVGDEAKLYIYKMPSGAAISNSPISFEGYPIANTHANTMSFSNQFYQQGDEFPLLYISSGFGEGTPKTFHVYGVRIQRNNNNFSAAIVKTIAFTGTGGWMEFMCADSKAWIKYQATDGWKWLCIDMPALNNSSTIDMDSLTPNFTTEAFSSYCQGHMYYNKKIYVPEGYGRATLHVIDTNTGITVTKVDLGLIYTGESEGIFIYDNHFYIMFRGIVYKMYFD